MDFSTAFSFFTEDDSWKRKFGIAGLLIGIPAVITALSETTDFALIASMLGLLLSCITLGYSIEVAHTVRDGEKHRLPAWSLRHLLNQGGTIVGSLFVYIILLGFLIGIVAATGLFGTGFVEFILSGEPSSSRMALFAGLFTLFSFVVAAMVVNYIRHNTNKACFQFKNIYFIIRKRWKMLIWVTLLSTLSFLFTVSIPQLLSGNRVGELVFVTLISFTLSALMVFVNGHLYGQIASLIDADELGKLNVAHATN